MGKEKCLKGKERQLSVCVWFWCPFHIARDLLLLLLGVSSYDLSSRFLTLTALISVSVSVSASPIYLFI